MNEKYYSNLNFSIREKEVIKIDIKEIQKKIEKEDINLCVINLNINQSKYDIKSFKNLSLF